MTTTDYTLIAEIEQFYYREARLLDDRCFQQWLAIVDESMIYTMPTRHTPLPNPKEQDTEAFLSVANELDQDLSGHGAPLRSDNYFHLLVRTIRPLKTNAWADSPAPRTRRFISNVEVCAVNDKEYQVNSNFMMFYSHEESDNHTYSGARRDTLKRVEGELKICKREVITDWNIVTVPTLALIF